MSQDVAARLVALSQDHREGRLTVSAYRSLRAPLLDILVTADLAAGTEPVDPSTTTLPRHRDPLVEASALARTSLQAAAQAEQSRRGRLRPMVIGALFLAGAAGLIAAWVTGSPGEPVAPPVVETAEASPAPERALTPMPPPLPKETKRKSAAPPPPPIPSVAPPEPGPRMLVVAGPTPDSEAFSISARPVSQAQFRLFCQKTARPYPRQPWSEDDDPVVNVTWDDARAYLVWLSSISGKRYRLATETEWLYFASQVTVDARWRNGNVREWLQDDASDTADDTRDQRVVRGVSYADAATDLLSARRAQDASIRDALTGFRALRESH